MQAPEKPDLGRSYKQYFQIVPACTDALRDEVYRVRHQVFCEDLAFESQRPDHREIDEYDAHSIHVLIRSIKTGDYVGCTRIVRTRPKDPLYPLPFEKICANSIDRSIIDPTKLNRDTIAEVSRLAVVSQFRRRKGEDKYAISVSDEDFGVLKQPRFPYIPISLYLAATELARLNGIQICFVLTEERLATHFRKIGFNPETIGSPVEHRGSRIPSMMSPTTVLGNLREVLRPLYQAVAVDIASHSR